ncbi:Protein CBG04779 [Caenorhabditis briggsae]|uniref:Protein CBG04779 n=1 Tax=Caenorhabditis briggsae TaxID=6238 RepID=A8WYG3_CAEBR|nr:Protein CBG04779 [Caenorhabditis briggsae]CAP25421.1 Protein CBG04779 [Caenorhabditis briggsae]
MPQSQTRAMCEIRKIPHPEPISIFLTGKDSKCSRESLVKISDSFDHFEDCKNQKCACNTADKACDCSETKCCEQYCCSTAADKKCCKAGCAGGCKCAKCECAH